MSIHIRRAAPGYPRALVIALFGALIIALPTGAGATTSRISAVAAAPSGSFFYSYPNATGSLDPDLQAAGIPGMAFTELLYDTLVYMNPDGSLKPLLATSWKLGSDSHGPYAEFVLRKGLHFPDGAPFNSTTVAVRIRRGKLIPGSLTLPDLSGVQVKKYGDYRVRLYSPNAVALPGLMSGPAGMMISQLAINSGAPLATQPAGIGMYNLKSFAPGLVTYTANPNYWDKSVVKIKTVSIAGNGDDNARLNLMRTNGVQLTYLNPALDSSATNLGYKLYKANLLGTYNFAINTSIAPFNNLQVRQAMSMALDRKGLNDSVFFGECTPTSQLYPVNSSAYNPKVSASALSYNPAAAKALISAAGATGTKVTLLVQAAPSKFPTLAAAVQAEWQAIGLDVQVRVVPFPQVLADFDLGQAAVAFVSAGSFSDSSQAVATYLAPNSLFNPGKFDDPQITKSAAEGLKQTDPVKRARIYQSISARASHTLTFIPILSIRLYYWVAPNVKNFTPPIAPAHIAWRSGMSVS